MKGWAAASPPSRRGRLLIGEGVLPDAAQLVDAVFINFLNRQNGWKPLTLDDGGNTLNQRMDWVI
jgi:hypothetical protein